MRKEIIVVQIAVNGTGSKVYFQSILPEDTLYLEAVGTGLQAFSGNKLISNIAGTLQLQAVESPNQCYRTEIADGINPIETQLPGFGSNFSAGFTALMTTPYVAAISRRAPERIRLAGNNQLYGYYQDGAGIMPVQIPVANSGKDGGIIPPPAIYTVNLYLHIVLKN